MAKKNLHKTFFLKKYFAQQGDLVMSMSVQQVTQSQISGMSTDPKVLVQQAQVLELQRRVMELELQNRQLREGAVGASIELTSSVSVKKAASGSDKIALFRLQLEELAKKEVTVKSTISNHQSFISSARVAGVDSIISAIENKLQSLRDRLMVLDSGKATYAERVECHSKFGHSGRMSTYVNKPLPEASVIAEKAQIMQQIQAIQAWEQGDFRCVLPVQFGLPAIGIQNLGSDHLEKVLRYKKAKNALIALETEKKELEDKRKKVEEQMDIFLKQ